MKGLILIGLVFVASGCAVIPDQYMKMGMEGGEGKQVTYSSGSKVVRSEKSYAVSMTPFQPYQVKGTRAAVWISVENNGEQAINLGHEIVTADYVVESGEKISTPSMAYFDLAREIEQSRAKAERSARIGAALSMMGNTGTTSSTTTAYGSGSGSVYGAGGVVNYTGSQTTTAYTTTQDPVKKAAADNQTKMLLANQVDRINASSRSQMEDLDRYFFKKQTVPAGNFYSGVIVLDSREIPFNKGFFDISVNIEGEVHDFKLLVDPILPDPVEKARLEQIARDQRVR